MNLVTSIANAARIAEQRHAALLIEAASLEGQASAAKAAADAKRKRARGLQSIMSRLRGTCHAIEAADPAVIADLGLSPEPSSSPASTIVDLEPAPVVEGTALDPGLPAPDGQAEAGTADADRDADDDPGASCSSDAGLVEADAAVGPDRDNQGEGASSALIVHKHEKIQQPAAKTDDPAERVFAVLEAERSGTVSSLEWVDLLKRTKLSPARLKNGLETLKASGRIREVRAAERGTKTFLMAAAAEAAE